MSRLFQTRLCTTTLVISLSLSGCATPYVVKLPETQLKPSAPSSEQALKFLYDTRAAYRGAVEEQITAEQSASNVLIGAGALITALASGKVHRDAVLGATALAGTGYALTNNNLPRGRLQVHAEAIRALNCAERAMLPLLISDGDHKQLIDAVAKLKEGRLKLQTEMRRARVARDSAPGADPWHKSFSEAETLVIDVLDQTARSVTAAEGFLAASSRAAIGVVSWVNTLHDNSVIQLAEARSPLSDVPRLVQGLTQDMGKFVPGTTVDQLLGETLKGPPKLATSQSRAGSTSPLESALDQLEMVARATAQLQIPVNNAIWGRNLTFAEDAFKDCNVAQIVTALTVTPGPLKYTAQSGGQQILEIKGGIKPYFIQLDGDLVAGLSYPGGPIRGGEAEIALKPGAVTTETKTGLRISDSSAAGQGVRIKVEISATPVSVPIPAPTAGKTGGAKPQPQPINVGTDAAIAALKKLSKFESGGVTFERKGLPVKAGDRIEIVVICPDTSTVPMKRAALSKSYLTAAGVMDFPVDKLSLTTEPEACAPS